MDERPLTYVDALAGLGRHEEHEGREEGEDDGRPHEHVHVVHARAPHVDRVHDRRVLVRRHVVKHLQ